MMNREIREQMSALLDSELAPHEMTGTLKQLSADDTLRQTWDRYHLIGDVMRGEGVRPSALGVADAVRERLAQEPAILAMPKPAVAAASERPWLRPLAGAAIAASVAVLAILTVPKFTEQGLPEQQPIQVASVPVTTMSTPSYATRVSSRWKNLAQPKVESKLNSYLVDHSEYASLGGMGDLLPYTTFVSYSANGK